MNHVLVPAALGPTGRPRLSPGEAELQIVADVDLSWTDRGHKHEHKGCDVLLSSLRLVFVLAPGAPEKTAALAMDLGLLEKHSKVSGLRAVFASPRLLFRARHPREPGAAVEFLLRFGGGSGSADAGALYERVRTAYHGLVAARERQARELEAEARRKQGPREGSGAGIGALLRRDERQQQRAAETLSGAFADLDSLMANAQEIVQLAERYGAALAAEQQQNQQQNQQQSQQNQGSSAPEDLQFHSVLQDLGMVSPVTKATAGTAYHDQLSRQLAEFVMSYWEALDRKRRQRRLFPAPQVCTLTDAYCLFNRARGTELISPDDLLTACRRFPRLRLPLRLREFPGSGVLAIQSLGFSEEQLGEELLGLLREKRAGLTALELSEISGASLVLCAEQLLSLERRGLLCRDTRGGVAELRFFQNLFLEQP